MSAFHVIKYLHGYVYVHLTGYATERFLNLCGNRNILIWGLKPAPDGYFFYISVNGYRNLKPLLKKTKTKARIIHKYGFGFWLFRYRKHTLFACGIFISAALLYVCSCYIWKIEIIGNSYLTDDSVITFLQSENSGFGSKKSHIDCEQLENSLRTEFPDIIWCSVEIYGTRLTVELQERLMPDETHNKKDGGPYDIIAAKDGKIFSIVTRTGTPLVTEGIEVSRGDLLVSGRLEILSDDGETISFLYPGADADILATITYSYSDEINLLYQDKIKTGEKKHNWGLCILNYYFTNPIFRLKDGLYEKAKHVFQFHMTDNFFLPVSFLRYDYDEYRIEEKKYTDKEAVKLAEKHFSQYLTNLEEKGIQILEKNVMIEKGDQKYVVYGTIEVLESIVALKPTEILEITSEERQQLNESD